MITIFFFTSCNQQEVKKNNLTKKTDIDSLSEYLISKIEKFSLGGNTNMPDSNELFLYYAQRFDTSLLVHFKKERGEVRAVVYQVTRPYYRNGEGLDNDNKEGLQFFEGYSFKVDSIQWKSIAKEADSILMTGGKMSGEDDDIDASYYILAFNSRIRSSSSQSDNILLSEFTKRLKNKLLNQCMAKKPSWQRED